MTLGSGIAVAGVALAVASVCLGARHHIGENMAAVLIVLMMASCSVMVNS